MRVFTDRRRLQVRITFDSDMGPLFDWVATLPERARAREVVGLLRVGYAMSSGNAGAVFLSAAGPGGMHPTPPMDRRQDMASAKISTPSLELQGAEEALEIFDAASVTGVPPP